MEQAPSDAIQDIIASLESGKHVILQFGRHNRLLDYMLVANIVTRLVRDHYRRKVERFEETKAPKDRPRPLVITIEEAHKFLNPAAARQTTFGIIARELRKFLVTLLVIDQRPSGIDTEVMSQLGTRVTGKLTEESDIDAVLTGVGGRSFLRGAHREPQHQAGGPRHGSCGTDADSGTLRRYDEDFYRALSGKALQADEPDTERNIADLFG